MRSYWKGLIVDWNYLITFRVWVKQQQGSSPSLLEFYEETPAPIRSEAQIGKRPHEPLIRLASGPPPRPIARPSNFTDKSYQC